MDGYKNYTYIVYARHHVDSVSQMMVIAPELS